ncbi:MAG: tetratricopeptide repeat protein [Flavobacterium sp.]|nr:tetratricopeptide repeat protein [Flavobacterium sp.]
MFTDRIIKIVFLFIFSTINLVAQNTEKELKLIWENPKNADSIRLKAINEYYPEVVFSNPDKALTVSNLHYSLAQKSNVAIEKVKALKERGKAYYVKGNTDKAIESLKEAIVIQSTLNDDVSLARLNSNLANVYREQNKFFETVKYYNLSLKIFQDNKEENAEADILNNLGLVYFDINNNELALDYFNKALKLYEKLNLQDKIGNIWLNIGSAYFEEKDNNKAIKYAQKALKILESNNNLLSSSDCYLLMAKSNQRLNNSEKAFLFAQKSLELNQNIGNTTKVLDNKIYIAELTFNSNVKKATKIGEEVLPQLKADTDKKIKAKLYQLLYKCYKAENKVDLSHKMYDQYIVYNDSIIKEKSNLSLIKESLNQEFKNSQEALKKNQLKRIIFIILIFLSIILLLFFYSRKKSIASKKKRDELLKEIKELKNNSNLGLPISTSKFELNRTKIETSIDRKMNETDWNVLNILLDDPVISNKDIAEKAFMSVDGIGSSLKRMYEYFEIKESKYKKTSLIMKAIKLSNN